MKKVFALALILGLLASCQGPTPPAESATSEKPATSDSTGPVVPPEPTLPEAAEVLENLKLETVAIEASTVMDFRLSSDKTLITHAPTDLKAVGTSTYYHMEEYLMGQLEGENTMYRKEDGSAVGRRLMPDNTIQDIQYVDSDRNPISFDDNFANPFVKLTEDNIEIKEEEGVYKAAIVGLDEGLAHLFSSFISGYQDLPLDTLEFDIDEDGKVLQGYFKASEENVPVDSTQGPINVDVVYTSEFSFVEPSKIGFTPLTPFAETEESRALDELFASLRDNNYTMEMAYKGGLPGSERTIDVYFSDEAVVRVAEAPDGTVNASGVYQVEPNKLADVVLEEDGKIHGTGTTEEGTIDDYTLGFLFSGTVFDYADGVYTLKAGYELEDYIQYTAPDVSFNFTQYLYHLVPGTYTVQITEEGAIFEYAYAYQYYGEIVTGTITLTLTDIGTTQCPYEYVPYVEEVQEGWADLGADAIAVFEKYLGASYADLLPYVDLKKAASVTVRDTTYMGETYGQITIKWNSQADQAAIMEGYGAALLEAGWKAHPAVASYANYAFFAYGDGTSGARHVGFMNTVAGLSAFTYIRFNAVTPTLTDFANEHFANGPYNLRLGLNLVEETYALGADGNKGELTSTETTSGEVIYRENFVWTKYGREQIFYQNGANVEIWLPNSSGDGGYNKVTSNQTTLEEYSAYGYYAWPSVVVTLAGYFTGTGEDGLYTAPAELGSQIVSIFGERLTSGSAVEVSLDLEMIDSSLTVRVVETITGASDIKVKTYEARFYQIGHDKGVTLPSDVTATA